MQQHNYLYADESVKPSEKNVKQPDCDTTHHSSQKKNWRKRLSIENLNSSVREEDLVELLGLNSTKYLRNTSRVELPTNKATRLNKGLGLQSGFNLSFGSAVVKIYPFATLCWVNKDENM